MNQNQLDTLALDKPSSYYDLSTYSFFNSGAQSGLIDHMIEGNLVVNWYEGEFYNSILKNYGWDKGWQILHTIAANSNIYSSIEEVITSLITNETVVSPVPAQLGLKYSRESNKLDLILPDRLSEIIPGSYISLAKNLANSDGANAFVEFLISSEGLRLYFDFDKPVLPVSSSVYEDPVENEFYNVLTSTHGIHNTTYETSILSAAYDLFHYCITNVHEELTNSWNNVVSAFSSGDISNEEYRNLLATFGEVPINQTQAENYLSQLIPTRLDHPWTAFALEKFNTINSIILNLTIPNSDSKENNPSTEESKSTPKTTQTSTKLGLQTVYPIKFLIGLMVIIYQIRKRKRRIVGYK